MESVLKIPGVMVLDIRSGWYRGIDAMDICRRVRVMEWDESGGYRGIETSTTKAKMETEAEDGNWKRRTEGLMEWDEAVEERIKAMVDHLWSVCN